MARNNITKRWPTIDFYHNVQLILTVPAEWSEREIQIMRKCAFDASLIKHIDSTNLKFITERMYLSVIVLVYSLLKKFLNK